jgi:molecular chaperone HtpG
MLDMLPFETSLGTVPFSELRKLGKIQYVQTVDAFRQIAQVASAQRMAVVNAGYSYDIDLLERAAEVFPELDIESIDAESLVDTLSDVSMDERERVFDLVRIGDLVLQPYKCRTEIKKFQPAELPVLFVASDDASFLRSLEQSKEQTTKPWAGVLSNIADNVQSDGYARLYFNFESPLVRRLGSVDDETALRLIIPMLYVQALLLGHHPLSAKELSLLNVGLLDLIQWGLDPNDGTQLQ